ncbi:MAG: PEP-CTERM sorting domain-containing protein [Halioglobus sp.]|nr:PEP-CTERM sorting domain-containing protein [Halioglobus sp.]
MKKYLGIVTLLATTLFMSTANAGLMFVGSWDVYNDAAPTWSSAPPNGPPAYTGQEAAALLFGGNAADYSISTIDSSVANINNMAWYDVIGTGGNVFAENYSNKYLGQYYGPTDSYVLGAPDNAASAFIRDNLFGANAINYAFINSAPAVPEPAVLSLLFPGLFGLAMMRRRPGKSPVA